MFTAVVTYIYMNIYGVNKHTQKKGVLFIWKKINYELNLYNIDTMGAKSRAGIVYPSGSTFGIFNFFLWLDSSLFFKYIF